MLIAEGSDDMEYIRKDIALKKLQMQLLDLEADQDKGEYSELCENRGARDALDEAIYDIRTIKGEDVQPVKRGHWVKCDYKTVEHGEVQTYIGQGVYCSNCRTGKHKNEVKEWACCPHCGARMNGE